MADSVGLALLVVLETPQPPTEQASEWLARSSPTPIITPQTAISRQGVHRKPCGPASRGLGHPSRTGVARWGLQRLFERDLDRVLRYDSGAKSAETTIFP